MAGPAATSLLLPAPPRRPPRPLGGFTLAEVLGASAASALLLAGLVSTLWVATRTADHRRGPWLAGHQAGLAAADMAADLEWATGFTVRTATTVEFTVPDRTGDGSPETLRYEWSGTPGDPLRRRVNGQPLVDYVPDVHHFHLAYDILTTEETTTGEGETTSPETLLASFSGWSGLTPTYNYLQVSSSYWIGQYFEPAFPSGATKLEITRAELQMRNTDGDSQTFTVAIHPAVSGTNIAPQGTPLAAPVAKSSSQLSGTPGTVEAAFSGAIINNPASPQQLVLLVKGSGTNTAEAQYWSNSSAPANGTVCIWTTSSGGTWIPSPSSRNRNDMPFSIYGKYTTISSQPTTTYRYFVRGARVALQAGSDAAARVETNARILNAPETASP